MNEHNYIEELLALIKSGTEEEELIRRLEDFHENDIASAFTLLSESERIRLCAILDGERIAEILSYVDDAGQYLKELDIQKAAKVIGRMDPDKALDALEEIEEPFRQRLMRMLDTKTCADLKLLDSYEKDEIGSKMTTNFILVRRNMTVQEARKALVAQAEKNDNISAIYVCDEKGIYCGALELKDLIIAGIRTELEPLISTSYPYVGHREKIADCLDRIMDYGEESIPVLNEDKEILGVITSQDMVEVVDDALSDDYAKLAGLTSEEELREPPLESIKKRMPWLLILLLLGIGVSTVVGMFEHVVAEVALVICFQSMILDMAGNAGTQSLAVTIRVLMDEELGAGQKFGFVLKELRVGFCNGLFIGTLAFVFVGLYIGLFRHYPWSYAFLVSGCVGLSLVASMVISSLLGTVVPMLLHKLKFDPAVASGPLITTVNDLVAVVAYYGLAWLLLLHVHL